MLIFFFLAASRVSGVLTTHWDYLYQHQGSSISVNSCIHDIQEPDHHPHRLRGGFVVWGFGDGNGPVFIWIDGT